MLKSSFSTLQGLKSLLVSAFLPCCAVPVTGLYSITLLKLIVSDQLRQMSVADSTIEQTC